jgi:fatty-acyl-CoA synthase
MIKNLGLKPKDRIGIYSYNKWEWFIIQLAAAMADLILVNINPAYQSE